ncbi:MAG TPA: hypothetical protein VIQ27_04055 [Gemmatimonadales bacterium]|jgi:hypothetical protein
MNMAHLHLMLNHFPVVGAPLLLALLAYGLARGSPDVTRIALWATVVLGVVTLVVYLTGEPAEELVEALPTFDHDMLERHEAVALGATVILVATAVLAGLALRAGRSDGRLAGTMNRLVLAGLLAGTAGVAATGWTGGPIGHPEIRPGAPVAE